VAAPEDRREAGPGMPETLAEHFIVLSHELTLLGWQWQQYAELFAGSPARLALMNGAAPFFFWLVQRTLWEEMLLGISRLVGPTRSMGRDNLTIAHLPELIADEGLRSDISVLVSRVVDRAAFAKAWRNKRLAHRDLDLSLGKATEALPEAQKEELAGIIANLAAILNKVENYYLRSMTMYRNSPITGGGLDLLYVLRDGARREDIRQKRLEAGEYIPEDWNDDAPAI
jgi:hypothetical protein